MPAPLSVLLLAHDLSDTTIHKRITMLQAGGAVVTVAGFRRGAAQIDRISGLPVTDFGQTHNGSFGQRIRAVLRLVIGLRRHRALFQNVDLILARNLEMLALAVRGRSLCRPRPVIVYEALDIHRLLLGHGPVSGTLRWLEGWLGRRAKALLTSSPAFVDQYFNRRSALRLPARLIENKLLSLDTALPAVPPPPGPPPFVIGWFGIIRCRRSLALLTDLVRRLPGKVEVVIRGKPALDQFDDFHAAVTGVPGLRFLGPYRPEDLAALYGAVHFSWAIDLFEAGLNSDWLLPNRLYEGGLYGAVPLAQAGVATGEYLAQRGFGVTLAEPLADRLTAFFDQLTVAQYQALHTAMAQAPRESWVYRLSDCVELVSYLQSVAHG